MHKKPISQSQVTLTKQIMPQDTNPTGIAHGGVIMHLIDNAAAAAAMRHARCIVVTASVDRMDFRCPVHVGDLVFAHASVNHAGRSSMEIGVRVAAENPMTGETTHAVSAYLTYVALDDARKPTPVPELVAETDEDKRRMKEAAARHEIRKQRCAQKKSC